MTPELSASLARVSAAIIQLGCAGLAFRLAGFKRFEKRRSFGWALLGVAILLIVTHGFYRSDARLLAELMGVLFSLVMFFAMFELLRHSDLLDQEMRLDRRNLGYQRAVFTDCSVPLGIADSATGVIVDCNGAFASLLGFDSVQELIGKSPSVFSPPSQPDGGDSGALILQKVSKARLEGTHCFPWRHLRPNGEEWDGEVHLKLFQPNGKEYLEFFILDITDRLRLEKCYQKDQFRLKALNSLMEAAGGDEALLVEQALEAALGLTDSAVGYLHFLHPEDGTVEKSCWSKKILEHSPVPDYKGLHPNNAGLWADSFRRRSSVIQNDFIGQGGEKGLPLGHISITRHMTVPVFDGESIVILAGVGNKASDYTEQDATQLHLFIVGVWNIVCRKRAEHSLRKLNTAVEQSPASIVITDRQGNIEYVNPAFERITQYKAAQVIGQNPRILKTGYFSVEQYQELWGTILSGRVWNGVFCNKRQDGQLFWERTAIAPIRKDSGEITNFLAVKDDITEARAVEEQLRESEERWHFAMESAGHGLWDWDVASGKIYHSERWRALLGESKEEEFSGLDAWSKRIYPADVAVFRKDLSAHLDGETSCFFAEYRIMREDGAYVWMLDRGRVVRRAKDGKPLRLIGTHTDITERKLSEQTMANSRKMESLAMLAGGIAHDFNNLFTSALGNLDIAELTLGKEMSEYENLEKIRHSILKASQLSRQMMAFSGIGRFNLDFLDLNYLLQECREELERAIGHTVPLEIHFAETRPFIDGDARQVRQILEYLVVNASEAMEGRIGIIRISTNLEMIHEMPENALFFRRAFEPGLYVIVSVVDQGCGMDAEVLSRIFEPFFSTKFIGRGMSLAVVQGIMRAHGGGVKVASRVGEGTQVFLYFPASHQSLGIETDSQAIQAPERCRRILLVDDDELLRSATATLLRGMGNDVLEAEDGLEAVELYRERHQEIGLVIMDLTMPRMDGRTAFLAMKDIDREAQVILSSGYGEGEVTEPIESKGLAGFLSKPYQYKDLSALVEKLLGA